MGKEEDPIALYVHLPFCESLCYYCGCNIQITHDRSRSAHYVRAVMREIESVAKLLGTRKKVSQIAWGGGTPTFLSVEEIQQLQKATLSHFALAEGAEVGVEIDPRVTSREQLEVLRELGFNRVSLGVQDFNLDVQKAVNRVQSAEMTESMLQFCRSLGYQGNNFDLIYGLPHQTLPSFEKTIREVIRIRPDRIALYNYAHLPSLRPHQKILEKQPMPLAEERVEIFLTAYDLFLQAGYRAIGMDHFAVAEDELSLAIEKRTLYRNFQGYSVRRGSMLLGFGASAIGEVGTSYFQNRREPKEYEASIEREGLATFRGCIFSEDDIQRKWIIQNLMCRFQLDPLEFEKKFHLPFDKNFSEETVKLIPFVEEGILEMRGKSYFVTELGRLFVRNVAMLFDAYLKHPQKATYSRTV